MACLEGYLLYRKRYTVTFNEVSVFPSYKSPPKKFGEECISDLSRFSYLDREYETLPTANHYTNDE